MDDVGVVQALSAHLITVKGSGLFFSGGIQLDVEQALWGLR